MEEAAEATSRYCSTKIQTVCYAGQLVFQPTLKLHVSQDSWCQWSERKLMEVADCFRAQQTIELFNIKSPAPFYAWPESLTCKTIPSTIQELFSVFLAKKLVLQIAITYTTDHWQKLQQSPDSEDMSCLKLWNHRCHSHYRKSHILVKSWSLQIPIFYGMMQSVGCVLLNISEEYHEPPTQQQCHILHFIAVKTSKLVVFSFFQ